MQNKRYKQYRDYFKQGLDESFHHVVKSQELRSQIAQQEVGSPEYHIASGKMNRYIGLHHEDLAKFHSSQGNEEKAQEHMRLAQEAHKAASAHIAQYHFASARKAAEAGDVATAIRHQTKGEEMTA